MNVLIVTKKGIMQTPVLIQKDIEAEAAFDKIAEELLGEDYAELNRMNACDYGFRLVNLDYLLKGSGNELNWFDNIEIKL